MHTACCPPRWFPPAGSHLLVPTCWYLLSCSLPSALGVSDPHLFTNGRVPPPLLEREREKERERERERERGRERERESPYPLALPHPALLSALAGRIHAEHLYYNIGLSGHLDLYPGPADLDMTPQALLPRNASTPTPAPAPGPAGAGEQLPAARPSLGTASTRATPDASASGLDGPAGWWEQGQAKGPAAAATAATAGQVARMMAGGMRMELSDKVGRHVRCRRGLGSGLCCGQYMLLCWC